MALTPETLPRHELNGLYVRVVEATDPGLVGVEGRVVVETAGTLHVEDRARDGVVQVGKRGATFEFAIEASDPGSHPADAEKCGTEHVTVDGHRLTARPARRTERRGDPTWR
ncbi:ribonuclease P [Halobacteriales archaeon QS_8_69_26]|nr:MAG: ribonuclease P [Halobacteriales archaeon QS_8_69_26]